MRREYKGWDWNAKRVRKEVRGEEERGREKNGEGREKEEWKERITRGGRQSDEVDLKRSKD